METHGHSIPWAGLACSPQGRQGGLGAPAGQKSGLQDGNGGEGQAVPRANPVPPLGMVTRGQHWLLQEGAGTPLGDAMSCHRLHIVPRSPLLKTLLSL